MLRTLSEKIARDTENKADGRLFLFFIPVAYISFVFHELGHYAAGELLGNRMVFSLNYVWPLGGNYRHAADALYASMGGPAFTILLSVMALLLVLKFKSIYAYAFVIFQITNRFFALVFGGFGRQDEARIAEMLGTGRFVVALVVMLLLAGLACLGSRALKLNFKTNWYLFTVSIICMALVITTYTLL